MKHSHPKTAVITGAASGIGLALTRHLSRHGTSVLMADSDEHTLRHNADQLASEGASVRAMSVELTDPIAVGALASEAFDVLGEVDVVFNNAGVLGPVGIPLWEMPIPTMRRVFEVNHWSHVLMAQAFVPRLLRRRQPAHIVHTASMSAFVAGSGSAAYAASKHADLAVARSLRADLEGTNIRVSVLCPGLVETPLVEGLTAPRGAGGATKVSAEHVAQLVCDALGSDRFYLFTNPDSPSRMQAQLDELRAHLDIASPNWEELP